MTTLHSFQAEIDDIRSRELAKTRIQSHPEALRRGHTDKDKSAPKARKKAGGDTGPSSHVTPKVTRDDSAQDIAQDISDIEHSFQVRRDFSFFVFVIPTYETIKSALLSSTEGDAQARDLIRAPLFANEVLDTADGWTGEERIEAEIDTMIERIGQLVEEVGGKVHFLYSRSSSSQALISIKGLCPISCWGTAPPSFRFTTITSARRVSHPGGTMCGGWQR